MMGQEVSDMWFADAARRLEELNEPDPYEDALMQAAKSLEIVLIHLGKAQDALDEAWSEFDEDTPMSDRILSLYDDLEAIKDDIRNMKTKWERGHRG